MAMMSLKFESDQRKEQAATDAPRQNVIYEPLDIASRLTVPVSIEPTDASERCRLGDGEYLLHVCRSDIILMDPNSKKMKQQWLYRYIRMYTNTPSVFSFEAGCRCASGEGLFSFKTPMAAKLSVEVQDAVQALQNTEPSEVERTYMSMKKRTTHCDQENIDHTTTVTSTSPSAAQRVCYENVHTVKKTLPGSQSSPVTGNQSKQKHTEDSTDVKSTTTSKVQSVCYENVAAAPKRQDADDHMLAREQTNSTRPKSTNIPAVQRVCYENVSTTSTAQTSQEFVFMVEVEETEVSRRCKLNTAEYQLRFDTAGINLEDANSKTVLHNWPYNVIRRFGCSQELFLVEVGRRAASGEGLLKFKTTTPDTLRTALMTRRGLQRTNSSASSAVAWLNQHSPPGEQRHATAAVDDRRVNENEAPFASIARQESVRYTALARPSGHTCDVHSYLEVVAEPTGQGGGSH